MTFLPLTSINRTMTYKKLISIGTHNYKHSLKVKLMSPKKYHFDWVGIRLAVFSLSKEFILIVIETDVMKT